MHIKYTTERIHTHTRTPINPTVTGNQRNTDTHRGLTPTLKKTDQIAEKEGEVWAQIEKCKACEVTFRNNFKGLQLCAIFFLLFSACEKVLHWRLRVCECLDEGVGLISGVGGEIDK